MILLTDVDETVLQWAAPFQRWVEAKGYQTNGDLRETHSAENLLGLNREAATNLVREFNHSGALTRLPPMQDAWEVIPDLHRDGWRFIAITACGTDEWLRIQRQDALGAAFGFHWEVHTVDLHASKRDILETFEPTLWVEDNLWHATEGASAGHQSYLLDRKYNQTTDDDYPSYLRVASWRDIARVL